MMRKGISLIKYGIPLATALLAGNISEANAQRVSGNLPGTAPMQKVRVDTSRTKQGIRSATRTDKGNDVGLLYDRPYTTNVALFPSRQYRFDISSDSPIKYTVSDAKKGVGDLVSELNGKFYVWGSDNSKFRDYWREVEKTIQPSDSVSVVRLTEALRNKVISPKEIYSNGKYQFKEGDYWITVESGNERKRMLVNFDLPGTPTAPQYNLSRSMTSTNTKPAKDSTKSQLETKVSVDTPTVRKNTTQAPKTYQPQIRPSPVKNKPRVQPVVPGYVPTRPDAPVTVPARPAPITPTADTSEGRDAIKARRRHIRDSVETARKNSIYQATQDSIRVVQSKDSLAKADSIQRAQSRDSSTRADSIAIANREKSHKYSPMRVTLDYVVGLDEPTLNAAFVARGGRLGMGGGFLGPFSLTASYLQRNDVNVQNLRIPLGTRVGVGTENHAGPRANGYGVELKAKALIMGVEKVFEGYNRELDERIETATGTILSRNQNSVAERRESTNFHVGLDVKRLRLLAQKDTKNRLAVSGGLRFGPSGRKGKR